jgi:photosystem II stability/assembly factor-like uncharacterized protein
VVSIALPPVVASGTSAGDVFVVARDNPRGYWATDPQTSLLVTHDHGATFTSLHGDPSAPLPSVRVNAVAYDPNDANMQTLYVGNRLGVYATHDGGTHWIRFGTGMPNVRVTSMFVSRSAE